MVTTRSSVTSSIIWMLTAAILFSRSNGVHDYQYAIGPVCECMDPAVDLGGLIKTCYRRCLMEPEPHGRVTIQMHQSSDSSHGPPVVECSRVVQEQTFTQTWTFSTVASKLSQWTEAITEDDCKIAIQANCPDYNCNHREADELTPEYHYGSATTVRQKTTSLLTIPSSIMARGEKLLISPMSTPDLYDVEAKIGSSKGKIYLWKDGISRNGCPFESVTSYGCDEYKGSDQSTYYMCAGGRFSVTPTGGEIAPQECSGLRASTEGFLYKLGSPAATEETNARIFITQSQGMTGDTDYLRHKIQQSLTHLDSEICTNQCEILALESRVSYSREAIVRLGMTYYKLYGNGTATVCKTINGCRLTTPKVMCGNPPRIGVTCASNSGLWDPLKPYMVPEGSCLKPDAAEKLSFHLGSSTYVVDDDLTIVADRNFSHGVYPTSFSDLHQSGVQLKIGELRELKSQWDLSKSSPKGLSTSTDRSHVIDSPSLSVGGFAMGILRSIPSLFSTIEHVVGIVIITGLAAITILFILKLVVSIRKIRNPRGVVRQEDDEQATHRERAQWI
ncbi:TPA_asm: G [Primula alphacytorhabdovirus 2]|nr:TPA_asm: G [Primula alphacytorhabdovirus 2]